MSDKSNNPDASKKQDPKHFASADAGVSGTKDDSECASLRIGNLPKPEKVRELPFLDPDKNAAKDLAAKQNSTDGLEGSVNVIPAGREHPTRVHGHK